MRADDTDKGIANMVRNAGSCTSATTAGSTNSPRARHWGRGARVTSVLRKGDAQKEKVKPDRVMERAATTQSKIRSRKRLEIVTPRVSQNRLWIISRMLYGLTRLPAETIIFQCMEKTG